MRTLKFELAGAPRGKERPRFNRATGKASSAPKTVHYEARLAHAAQIAMDGQPLFEGPLFLQILAFMPIPVSKPKRWQALALADWVYPEVKPDFDNIAKMVDALNLVVWTDDKQIVSANVTKRYSALPRLEVYVAMLDPKKTSIFD